MTFPLSFAVAYQYVGAIGFRKHCFNSFLNCPVVRSLYLVAIFNFFY
jgi:hypothetical protein